MARWRLGWGVGVTLALPTAAAAQEAPLVDPAALGVHSGMTTARYWAVPELIGAVSATFEASGRFDGPALLAGPKPVVPSAAISGLVGWRHYLDPWGRYNLHLYGGGGTSVTDFLEYREAEFRQLTLGLSVQGRGITQSFHFASLAAFVEGGPMFVRGGDEETPDGGFRWAVGAETGVGLLFYSEPYVFSEFVGRVGVESVTLGGAQSTTLMGSLRISFDFAITEGSPRPVGGDPYKQIPPL